MSDDVRILPISGFPLEAVGTDSVRSSFSLPEPGFLIGPDDMLVETAVKIALGESGLETVGSGAEFPFPILFYGPAGTGKSHLAHGIFSQWKRNFPKRQIAFYTGLDFAHSLANSLETRTVDDFRLKLRNLRRLVVDEIDALKGRKLALEEMQVMIDAIRDNGGHVVMTSRHVPGEKSPFGRHFTARIWGGLPVPLNLPSEPVRKKFLHWVAEHHRLKISATIIELLVREVRTTLPGIYGVFLQLQFEAITSGKPLNLSAVKAFLKAREEADRPDLAKIAKTTAAYFGLKLGEIRGKSRSNSIAQARSLAIFLARELTEMSLKEIGRYFGNRDHTTISHLNDSVSKRLGGDPELKEAATEIRQILFS